jgi:putative DNA methylase
MTTKKKLIEVALPLGAINEAAHTENNIHTGLPSNLHAWWSRKPLGIARAVLFSSLVDDPGERVPGSLANTERERLLSITARLADVSTSHDPQLLNEAKREIQASNNGTIPTFFDPFCGGGSLPLEAMRLGMPTIAADLNPVAVFITRVLIALAPPQAYHAPISAPARASYLASGAKFEGVKLDVEHYARLILERIRKRLGSNYPEMILPKNLGGRSTPVVAWIWARTVVCPNPSCRAQAPLVNKFWLSTHARNRAFAVPIFQPETKTFTFQIKQAGEPPAGTVKRTGAKCAACETPIPFDHIRAEGRDGRITFALMSVAVDGPMGRLYLPASDEQVAAAFNCQPIWEPDTDLPESALGFRVQKYGLTHHRDLFTKRQLCMLSHLADEIRNVKDDIVRDANGELDYAALLQALLAISMSRVAQSNNTLVRWRVRTSGTSKGEASFDRQIVSMVWEFAEGNLFGSSVGSWNTAVRNPLTALASVPHSTVKSTVIQQDASEPIKNGVNLVISTDPPYFDAVGYADLSDFFYVWLRKAIGAEFPDLFGTVLVPKDSDLTRDLGRHEIRKEAATQKFLSLLQSAFLSLRRVAHSEVPITVYYAFKQSEVETSDETGERDTEVSTGWETLLESLVQSDFQITGTWPLRTEADTRLRAISSNALASSIILVCRKRPKRAAVATRREFLTALKAELPAALAHLQASNIAPVDLAQAAIGPGMAVFTRYGKVIDSASGHAVTVREALAAINQVLDEVLAQQEGDFDSDTRWALAWFEQVGFGEGEYGVAEMLSKAKNTSIGALADDGILESKRGKVRLFRPADLPDGWDPLNDKRLTTWEMVHHLIRLLEAGGESAAAGLVAKLGTKAQVARELGYRLYTIAERKKRANEALSYNSLVQSWPEIQRLASEVRESALPIRSELF